MNLAQYIHSRWAADGALNALLPASRVSTGLYFTEDPGSCFGTITLPGGTVNARHNDGSHVVDAAVRIQVHHDNYDSGLAIANQVQRAFRDARFNLAADDRVLVMLAAGPATEIQDPDTGQWDFVIDFTARVDLPDGY